MHAFLIIGSNQETIDKKVKEVSKRYSAKILKFPAEKIADVRKLNSFISLAVDQKTAILLENIDKSTNEALNAFLKNLEEPQENLYFILTASSIYKVIPTIVSRCQLIKTNNDYLLENEKQISKFIKMNTGQKLLYLNTVRKREEAINLLQKVIIYLHQKLKKGDKNYLSILEISGFAEETLSRLEANGNVVLQLTNFAVNTDKIDTFTL